MARKKTVDSQSDLRKSLYRKLSGRAIDEYAGLTHEEILELLREAEEYASRWVTDCVRGREPKGMGAASDALQRISARIETMEDRKAARAENAQKFDIKEIKIVYQEPDPAIVAKTEGQADEG